MVTGTVPEADSRPDGWLTIPGWIWAGGGGRMARMAASERNSGTGGRGEDRKQLREKIAEPNVRVDTHGA